MRAARPRASAVAFGERQALGPAEQPAGTTEVKHFAVSAEHCGHEAGIGGHPPDGARTDRRAQTIDLARPEPRLQGVECDADDHADRRQPVCAGAVAGGHMTKHLGGGV